MSTSEYNSDELVPPSFLNESFVVKLLKKVEKDEDAQVRVVKILTRTISIINCDSF